MPAVFEKKDMVSLQPEARRHPVSCMNHAFSLQVAASGCFNPPSKASGIAAALFSNSENIIGFAQYISYFIRNILISSSDASAILSIQLYKKFKLSSLFIITPPLSTHFSIILISKMTFRFLEKPHKFNFLLITQ